MRIGGILLTITAYSCNNTTEVKCYDTAANNYMGITNEYGTEVEVNTDTGNVLLGYITGRNGKEFSFSIKDTQGKTLQKEFVLPVDSAFDTNNEDFKIVIDKNLKAGKYKLKLYATSPEKQDTVAPNNEFKLVIKQ